MKPPGDAIAAATHPDPYPYYAALAARAPLARDTRLGIWVAAGAAEIAAVLASDLCAVRPAQEPVPRALVGSALGEVFGRLVRMTEGPGQAQLKQAMAGALAGTAASVPHLARLQAASLAAALRPEEDARGVDAFAARLPVQVAGALLGIGEDELPDTAAQVLRFAAALRPGAEETTVAGGAAAAQALLDRTLKLCAAPPEGSLAQGLAKACRAAGIDEVATAANAVGLLLQPAEATAGLIGNALLALGRSELPRPHEAADPEAVAELVISVLSRDPPIHNTRRYVVRGGRVAGQEVGAGDIVLVLLAALPFGAGRHACPGSSQSCTIAAAGLRALLDRGVAPAKLARSFFYRPSSNARIPVFGEGKESR